MTAKSKGPRPRSVWVALVLIIVPWALALVQICWRMLTDPPLVDGDRPSFALTVVLLTLICALSAGLLAALAWGRRWAYIVILALFVLSLPGVVGLPGHLSDAVARGPLAAAQYVLGTAAGVTALVLLLLRPARQWYGISRRPTPPGEWRDDPAGRHQHRYWDGEGWTEHVADGGVAGVDPWVEAPVRVPLTSASS